MIWWGREKKNKQKRTQRFLQKLKKEEKLQYKNFVYWRWCTYDTLYNIFCRRRQGNKKSCEGFYVLYLQQKRNVTLCVWNGDITYL
jgi:hypothetical protein